MPRPARSRPTPWRRLPTALLVTTLAVAVSLAAAVVHPGAARAAVLGDRLPVGVAMLPGDTVRSPNGIYTLVLQSDGNVVEYAGGRAIWTTATAGRAGTRLILQGDGNLVLYPSSGPAVWASRSASPTPSALVLADDGRLTAFRSDGSSFWGVQPRADLLAAGTTLRVGQTMWSPTAQYRVILQGDGNLVLYTVTGVAVWSSGTNGVGVSALTMGTDGSLVLRRTDGGTAWSVASGVAGAAFAVTDDASAAVVAGTVVLWRTPATPVTLWRNQRLQPDQALTQGSSRLVMQRDGNLVRYSGTTAVWWTGTGVGGSYAVMQYDGNLVVYSAAGVAQWSSRTDHTDAVYVRISGAGLAFLGNGSRVPRWIEGPPRWAGLAQCESGGNPRAVNPAGYYGLYQFDLGTWAANGGTGNPIDASPATQTAIASTLYLARGRQPWPVCGKYL